MNLEGSIFGPRSGRLLAYHYIKINYIKVLPKKLPLHIYYV